MTNRKQPSRRRVKRRFERGLAISLWDVYRCRLDRMVARIGYECEPPSHIRRRRPKFTVVLSEYGEHHFIAVTTGKYPTFH